jgi:1,6-anhydro-N-acetylmuramate kinase
MTRKTSYDQATMTMRLIQENSELRHQLTARYCDDRFEKAMIEIQKARQETNHEFLEMRKDTQHAFEVMHKETQHEFSKVRNDIAGLRVEMQNVEKRMLQHYHYAMLLIVPTVLALLTPFFKLVGEWLTQQ